MTQATWVDDAFNKIFPELRREQQQVEQVVLATQVARALVYVDFNRC